MAREDRSRGEIQSPPPRAGEIGYIRDHERFLDMTMGELYEGKYGFMDILRREYDDLEVELKDKGDILAEVKRDADRIKHQCVGCKHKIKEYSHAIQQAQLGLEAVRAEEIARRSARGNKHSDDGAIVTDPRPGSDGDIEPRDLPDIAPKSEVPLKRTLMRIGSEEVKEALRQQAAGYLEKEHRRYDREEQPQHWKYPTGCTLMVDGIPPMMSERTFMPLLLSAFGHWDVPHKKIIGYNVIRVASRPGDTGTYNNRGQVIFRFANKEYMDEYCDQIRQSKLRCDMTGNRRELRASATARDLEIEPRRLRPGSSGIYGTPTLRGESGYMRRPQDIKPKETC